MRERRVAISLGRVWLASVQKPHSGRRGARDRHDQRTRSDDADCRCPRLRALVERLPDRSRKVLLAYWWMVREGGPCQPGDTFPHIYDTTVTLWGNEDDADVGYLRTLYPEAIPSFETWKKALHRIQSQFAAQPAVLAILHRIGLHRRRRR